MAIIASESQWGKGEKCDKTKIILCLLWVQKSIHDSTYPTIEDGLNAGAKKICMMFIFLKV